MRLGSEVAPIAPTGRLRCAMGSAATARPSVPEIVPLGPSKVKRHAFVRLRKEMSSCASFGVQVGLVALSIFPLLYFAGPCQACELPYSRHMVHLLT